MTETALGGDFHSQNHLALDDFWGFFELKSPGYAQAQQDPLRVPQAAGTGPCPHGAEGRWHHGHRAEPKPFLGPVQAARGVYVNISWLSPAASVSTALLETSPWWGTGQGEGRKPLKKSKS